jgi:competence protein ComEA
MPGNRWAASAMQAPRSTRDLLRWMTESETRVLARTAAVLLLVSAGRYAWNVRREPPTPIPPGDDLPTLIAESRRLEEDARRRERPLGPSERLDPNLAPESELDRLPGVGPAAARAMVGSRERDGPFAGPDDLLRVRGVGPATLARMRPYLEFGPVPAVAARRSDAGGFPPAGPPTLDLTRATVAELERLPGVGAALARRIVETREARGGFRRPEDLLEVRGIGPATLERLRPLVTVGRP